MTLIEKQTGWFCAHVQITSCPPAISASCDQGCEMHPLVVSYWVDEQ